MQIQFIRQHDGMFISAKTARDITQEVQKHYNLLLKLRKGGLSNSDGIKFDNLEQYIISMINWETAEEHGVIQNPFTTEDNITMLCI